MGILPVDGPAGSIGSTGSSIRSARSACTFSRLGTTTDPVDSPPRSGIETRQNPPETPSPPLPESLGRPPGSSREPSLQQLPDPAAGLSTTSPPKLPHEAALLARHPLPVPAGCVTDTYAASPLFHTSCTHLATRPSQPSSPVHRFLALLAFLTLSWSQVAASRCAAGVSPIPRPADTGVAHSEAALHHHPAQPTSGKLSHSHHHEDLERGECTMMLACTFASVESLRPAEIRSFPAAAFHADRFVRRSVAIVDRSVDPPPPRHRI